jgi:hypothetical protein
MTFVRAGSRTATPTASSCWQTFASGQPSCSGAVVPGKDKTHSNLLPWVRAT